MTGTKSAVLPTALSDKQKKFLRTATCNAENENDWNCNAFYFLNDSRCGFGFLSPDYVLQNKRELAEGRDAMYVRY